MNNINPLHVANDFNNQSRLDEEKRKNLIFFKGMYSVGKLDNITAMISSGKLTPEQYRARYAPRIFKYKQYVYDFIRLIDSTRDYDLMYMKLDAKNTLQEFEYIVQNFISTENEKGRFLFGRFEKRGLKKLSS